MSTVPMKQSNIIIYYRVETGKRKYGYVRISVLDGTTLRINDHLAPTWHTFNRVLKNIRGYIMNSLVAVLSRVYEQLTAAG